MTNTIKKQIRAEADAIDRYRTRAWELGKASAAIRAHCVECMGGSVQEIDGCPASNNCALWPWRSGIRKHAIDEIEKLLGRKIISEYKQKQAKEKP